MSGESTAPVPQKGGNGPFIAVAVLMVLIGGGLVFWKLKGGEEKPAEEPSEPVASAKPKKAPVFEDPPPPPPPPEEEEEEEKKPTKAASAGKYKGPTGCSGACKGTASAALKSALRAKAGAARGCYERALRQNSMLQGKMTVAVRISPGGTACSASITANSLGDPSVAACVRGIFQSGSYPKPQGGCVDTAVPLNFVPKT